MVHDIKWTHYFLLRGGTLATEAEFNLKTNDESAFMHIRWHWGDYTQYRVVQISWRPTARAAKPIHYAVHNMVSDQFTYPDVKNDEDYQIFFEIWPMIDAYIMSSPKEMRPYTKECLEKHVLAMAARHVEYLQNYNNHIVQLTSAIDHFKEILEKGDY